ncbi:MAG: hypothetical protein KAS72_15700 [Phycisphaerales bacterium]|nr:hypothetical protein [Phycisphaerales bacterium]
MACATDHDLLALEPNLFRDVAFSAQRLVSSSSASISGTTLTDASADFEAAGVTTGYVAVVDDVAFEVVQQLSATSLTISVLRGDEAGAAIPPGDVTNASLLITTFLPQFAVIHSQLLHTLGIAPDDDAGGVHEGCIMNPADLTCVEALGALEMILSAAASLVGESSTLWNKARLYRERYAQERQRTSVLLDTNGDGRADATRRINTVQFLRT